MHKKDEIMPKYAELIYNGYWYSKARFKLQKIVDLKRNKVNGYVKLKLYKGNITIVSRQTKSNAYSMKKVSFEENKTLIIHNQTIETGTFLLEKASSSSNDVSGAAFFPRESKVPGCAMNIEKTFKLNDLKHEGSITAIRIEGSKNSIDQRIENLINELKIINFNVSILETYQSEIFWNKIKNLEFFSSSNNSILRIVIPPSECVQLIYQLSNDFKYFLDWGGALMWMEASELSEQMFESIRKKVVKHGGYVTMIKNSDYLPYVEDVFTINSSRFNISQNIKKSFDPKRILNPGKMYTGI